MEAFVSLNNSITIFLNSFTAIPWVHGAVYFFAFSADLWIGAAGFLYLFFLSSEKGEFSIDRIHLRAIESMRAIFGVLVLWFVSFIIKIATHMPRPYVALSEIIPIAKIPLENYQSFPSGHTTLFFALATAIFLYHKKAGIIFYIFAALIAVGRIMAGVHFAGDIVGGVFLGVGGVFFLQWLFDTRAVK